MAQPSQTAPWKAHLALWGVGLIYAYNYLVAKGLMPDKVGPSGFIALRVAGATPLFWLLYAFRWERVARADLGRLWLCGLTGVTVNQLLFFNGLAATSPVHASIIMTVNPVLVLLISAAMLGTAITTRKVMGIALGAAGAIALLLNGGGSLESHASWQGDLMVLLNATSYGVYLVVVKPLMAKYRPLTVISWVFLFGGLMAFPVGTSQAAAIEWSAFSTKDWLSVGFVVLFTTFLVYLLNIYALGKVQPTVVSIYIYLQPLLVGLMVWVAAWLGGDDYMADMGWLQAGCAVVIALGVWLVSVPRGGWRRVVVEG